MKKVNKTIIALLFLTLALCFTGCDWFREDCEHTYDNACDTICNDCGEKREVAAHQWMDATCTVPKTCKLCGKTEAEPLGHTWADGSCESAVTCTVCGETAGKPFGHRWSDPDPTLCSSKITCHICGATEGEDREHSYDNDCDTSCNACAEEREISHSWTVDACGSERYCSVCGYSDGEIVEHNWQGATCTSPQNCTNCGETRGTALHHDYTDVRYDAEGHWYACPNCNESDETSFEKHSGIDPNCTERGYCTTCLQTYGAVTPGAHDFATSYTWAEYYVSVDAYAECIHCGEKHSESAETKYVSGVATVEFENSVFENKQLKNVFSGVNITADELKALVAAAFAAEEREIYIDFAADAPAQFITAVREAIVESDVEDGSVSLILTGIKSIPDNYVIITTDSGEKQSDGIAFGEKTRDENGVNTGTTISLPELLSVSLPHVTYIGEQAFQSCENLTTIYAPKVETVGRLAFHGTVLTEVDLPCVVTIGDSAFYNLDLKAVNIPSATSIGATAFANVKDNAKGYTLYLNAKGSITIADDAFHTGRTTPSLTTMIDVILNPDKYSKVKGNVWSGFKWKSIRLICSDGGFDHSAANVVYTFADDYSYCEGEGTCHKCGMKMYEKVNTSYSDTLVTAEFKTSGFEKQTKTMVLGTGLTPEEIQADVGLMLDLGMRTLLVYLPSDAGQPEIYAVRRAICDAEGVEDGSVFLTIEGLTSIPDADHQGYDFSTTTFGSAIVDMSFEEVTELKSISLLDVTYIGINAFSVCRGLAFVNAPKAKTIAAGAFAECDSLSIVELSADSEITVDAEAFLDTNTTVVALTLYKDKKTDVTENVNWAGYTWEVISFYEHLIA